MRSLADKVAMVAGATLGAGRSIAVGLGAAGATAQGQPTTATAIPAAAPQVHLKPRAFSLLVFFPSSLVFLAGLPLG